MPPPEPAKVVCLWHICPGSPRSIPALSFLSPLSSSKCPWAWFCFSGYLESIWWLLLAAMLVVYTESTIRMPAPCWVWLSFVIFLGSRHVSSQSRMIAWSLVLVSMTKLWDRVFSPTFNPPPFPDGFGTILGGVRQSHCCTIFFTFFIMDLTVLSKMFKMWDCFTTKARFTLFQIFVLNFW